MLKTLEANSVHCIVTSPPYWGLRDYGLEPLVWGGQADCRHKWDGDIVLHQRGRVGSRSTLEGGSQRPESDDEKQSVNLGAFCSKCGAWKGQLGMEPLHDCLAWARSEPPCSSCYVCHLRTIFAEVKRVIHPSGVMFLNLGDSYAGSWGNYAPGGIKGIQREQTEYGKRWERAAYSDTKFLPPTAKAPGLKPKDMVGIPWRVALALQADGWWLRSDIIWAKGISFCASYSGSVMPESVKDRPTKAHEYVFLFAKSQKYFYDTYAVREKLASPHSSNGAQHGTIAQDASGQLYSFGRNLRSVWTINPEPFPGSHFAIFPTGLVNACIRLGTSERGVCPRCLSPWVRIVERTLRSKTMKDGEWEEEAAEMGLVGPDGRGGRRRIGLDKKAPEEKSPVWRTIGWRPACDCNAGKPVPATVLEPFLGSGTTLLVAERLGRKGVGIELNESYVRMALERCRQKRLLPEEGVIPNV